MKALCGVIRALSGLGLVLALIAAALIFAPPVIVRYALLHYLDNQGIDATIGQVDANLFTGDISIDDAHGSVDGDTVFRIGHLSLGVRYPALLDQRLSLTHVDLADTWLDVRRSADNVIRIGGIDVVSAHPDNNTTSDWGFGLSRLRLGKLAIHYSQPATARHQAIDRQITFNKSSATDVKTWQPDDQIPMDADISLGDSDSRIQISGHVTPFKPQLSAHLRLRTTHLSLDRLAPISVGLGLDRLNGDLDSDQQIDILYDPARDLSVQTEGSVTWQNARIARHGGLNVQSRRLNWQGRTRTQLLRSDSQPVSMDARGTLQLANLSASQPGQFAFQQADGGWTGSAHATLASQATTIKAHGQLSTRQTRLSAPNRLKLSARQSMLSGDLNTRLASDNTHIQTDGSFDAQGMTFAIPDSVDFDSDSLDWQGKTTTQLGDAATRIKTDGRMNVDALVFQVPGTSRFTSAAVDWQGTSDIRSAALFARQAEGSLAMDDARLDIDGTPLTITADRLAYQGRYAEQPNAADNALRLLMDGAVNSHQFKVQNTAIGAAWFSAQQLHATKLAIDGLDRIRIPALDTRGIRILGDTDTSSAVLEAVSLDADSLALNDLAHYSADSVKIKNAIIHTRRTSKGYGVISEFFGGGQDKKTKDSSASSAHSGGPTFALRHFSLSGPAATFVDSAVTPNVNFNGLDINLTVDGLDTSDPDREADYRLSMDVGAYGHLDSRGKIAPMASKGINMNLDAWLRSLAMAPLSGYLDAAMGRRISSGAADGTLHLEATDGQLDGDLDTTLSNFRLANSARKETDIAYGISLDSALSLVRGKNDLIDFNTRILGDVTNPYFSIKNLIREAVLAGLRTTLLSDYSPVGLLNRARNAFLNLFRSVSDRPALFQPGYHYIRPDDRKYLGLIAQYMYKHPEVSLTVQGHANPGDHHAMSSFKGPELDSQTQLSLKELARQRGEAVRDYLAARQVNPARVKLLEPIVDDSSDARPRATFTLDKP